MACDDLGRLIVISIDAQVVNGAILVRTESDAEVLEMLEASRNGTLEEFARGRKTKFFGFSNI